MDEDWRSIAAGAALTSGLLAFEHVALWDLRGRLPFVVRYALGTMAIGAGVTFASPRTARVFWPIAVSGGSLVAGAHLLRALMAQPADCIEERVRHVRRATPGRN